MIDFKLSDDFVDSYRDKEVPWGYQDGAGNSLGEITFLRTYSRKDDDGRKETWVDTCRRVVEGMFSIQKRHCRTNHIEWKNDKAQRTAKDAFDRLFNMKWLPAGRGLWAMGSPIVMEEGNSAPLQSCAFVSTEEGVSDAMAFLFDASMLGVGVGFDGLGAGKFQVHTPVREGTFVIPDSREGWVESLRILLKAFFDPQRQSLPEFDYSEVRPAGAPIKRFGGVASGPDPLKRMHDLITAIMDKRAGSAITMTDIADIGNIIGTCVVAGNVRRCLPEGTRVHLTNGIRNIENVRVGDVVETSGKKARVTNVFDQGVQETVIVRYMGGELECTPNHQVAVFDTVDSWVFKRADELTTEDRIVWDREGITGVETDFPIYEAPERKSHDTTGQELDVPMLDSDSAWLIGMVHGDGYVFMPAGKTPNGSVSVASAPDTPGIPEAVARSLEEWGVRAHIRSSREGDAAIRISAHSTRLAEYFYDNVKRPNEPLEVPYWIKNAYPDIRIGYLAGLFDSDGSYKTRPLQALVTVYPEFANQVAELYASLGIQARATLARPAQGNNQALYAVNIVGGHNIRAFEATIAQHSLKYEGTRPFRSAGGATFSADMVRLTGLKAPDVYGKAPQNAERIENILGTYLPAIPYQVIEVVPSGRSLQTYDIEVEGIHQFTAEGIVVHNSAEIFFVDSDSEDFSDFLELKNYEKNPNRADWGWMSNNSVRAKVGDDLTQISEGIKRNGEPGVVWMDVTRNYGRLSDAPDYKDTRAMGYNPSLVAGTRVFTTEGVIEIQDLENKDFQVCNLNGKISPAYCWKSGVDEEVLRVSLVGGHSYDATPKHQWPVWTGDRWEKRKTSELKPGDKLPNIQKDFMYPEGTEGTYDEGFLIGWNLGDGWITRRPGGIQIGFMVGPQDRESGIDKKLEGILASLGSEASFEDKDEINVNNRAVRNLFAKFDVRHKTEGLPKSVWRSDVSDDFRRGLIDALLSADGTVDSSRISFSQASESMVRDVASLLGFFGIKTSINSLELEASKAFPDHYSEDYKDKKFTRRTLRVGEKSNLDTFIRNFTLTHQGKWSKIIKFMEEGKFNHAGTNWYVEIKDIQSAGTADVWDVTVEDDTHAFQVDHCVTGNCAEQPLENFETCNLVEVFVNNCEDQDDFIKTLKVAYLYGKTVTLLPTKWERTNTVMQRNRRIGLSASGVADFVDRHGMAKLRESLDDGYKYVIKLDTKYSEWLCIRESIRHTTMKPSGSISIVAGSSPGTHWTPGGEYFIRRITFSKSDPLYQQLLDAGYQHETLTHDSNSAVILFPIHSKSKRASSDVPAWEKIHLASEIQAWWSDNSVSCTVDFKPEEAEDIPTLLAMYDGKLKGISFLPAIEGGAYKHMPYEAITADDYHAMREGLKRADFSVAYRNGEEAVGEKFCATDFCEVEEELAENEGGPKVEVPLLDLSSL